MREEESEYVGYDGKKMFLKLYHPDGEPRGVVLCIHGLGAHSGLLITPPRSFAEAGLVVYVPDLRAFGRYDGIKGHVESIQEFVYDIDALVDRIREHHPGMKLFLWGHSFGGLLSVLYAEQHQDRLDGMIVVNPGLSERLKVSRVLRALVRLMSAINVKRPIANGLDLSLISKDPETVRRNQEDPLRYDFVTARFAAEGFASTSRARAAAPTIAIPVLVQQSEEDLIVVPEVTRKFYDNLASADKTWRSYEGLYHEPFDEEGGEVVMQDAVNWITERL